MQPRVIVLSVLFVIGIVAGWGGLRAVSATRSPEEMSGVPRQDLHDVLSTVNGVPITVTGFQDRVRLQRLLVFRQALAQYAVANDTDWLDSVRNQLSFPGILGNEVLNQMEREILIEQEAARRGLVVDEAAVNRLVDEYVALSLGIPLPPALGTSPTPSPTLTPTPLVSPTPRPSPTLQAVSSTPTFTPTLILTLTMALLAAQVSATLDVAADDFFTQTSQGAHVGRGVVYEWLHAQAVQDALLEDFRREVPTEVLMVNSRHILLAFDPGSQNWGMEPTDTQRADAQARADEVMIALQNGEPFAVLTQTLSDDPGSGAQGGELGWFDPNGYVVPYRDAVLAAPVGEIVGPVETQFGFHIIQVTGREVRPLTATEIDQRVQQAFYEWLEEQYNTADIVRVDNWLDFAPDDPSVDELFREGYWIDG
ncbi:MAG: hypothetical protein GYB65_16015 [Chloroflexi bacterium]|nr:hypothetical protein [Chloroflexota bacterium]